MKNIRFLLLVLPIVFSLFALSGKGFLYQAAVSVSCCIILLFVPDKKRRYMIWPVVAAFLFSVAGDWFLSHRNGMHIRFVIGIGLFLMGHIGYFIFCIRNGKIRYPFLFLLLVGYLLLFYYVLYPSVNDNTLLVAALSYLFMSCFSLAAATGLKLAPVTRWLFSAGIVLLIFSDTLIALSEFAGYRFFYFLMLPTYYGSQIVITLSLLFLPEDSIV